MKILITRESREVVNVRMSRRARVEGFCKQCGRSAEMVTLDESVSISIHTGREIVRHIEAGSLHAFETSSGHLFICERSLTNLRGGEIH